MITERESTKMRVFRFSFSMTTSYLKIEWMKMKIATSRQGENKIYFSCFYDVSRLFHGECNKNNVAKKKNITAVQQRDSVERVKCNMIDFCEFFIFVRWHFFSRVRPQTKIIDRKIKTKIIVSCVYSSCCCWFVFFMLQRNQLHVHVIKFHLEIFVDSHMLMVVDFNRHHHENCQVFKFLRLQVNVWG